MEPQRPTFTNAFPYLRQIHTMGEQDGEFPKVQGGGSLILAWQIRGKKVLVVGGGEVSPPPSHTRPFPHPPTSAMPRASKHYPPACLPLQLPSSFSGYTLTM